MQGVHGYMSIMLDNKKGPLGPLVVFVVVNLVNLLD